MEELHAGLVHLDDLPARDFLTPQHASVVRHQRVFGYTTEELKVLIGPMARTGVEPIGSMGTDTPVAVLSDRSRLLFDYFQQLFAQVTNPPLDAIREKIVTSVSTAIGPEGNLLAPGPESCRMVFCESPFLDNAQMARLKALCRPERGQAEATGVQPFHVTVLDMVFPAAEGPDGLEPALKRVPARAGLVTRAHLFAFRGDKISVKSAFRKDRPLQTAPGNSETTRR